MTEPNPFLAAVLTPNRRGPTCGVRLLLTQLDAEDLELADGLRLAIAHPLAQLTAISAALKARGYELKPETISRHRRNECKCSE